MTALAKLSLAGTGGKAANSALTVCAELMVKVQVDVPEQPAPLHPVNDEPKVGVAVKVTDVPSANDSEQSEPQSISAGDEIIDPLPDPDFDNDRTYTAGPVNNNRLAEPTPGSVTILVVDALIRAVAICAGVLLGLPERINAAAPAR